MKFSVILGGGQWFSQISSTNKTDRHDITEILLKVALKTTNQTKPILLFPNNQHLGRIAR
jgi:hypothetical protein